VISAVFLIPLSIFMGFVWVLIFLWTLNKEQYSDLDGSAERILYDEDKPLTPPVSDQREKQT